MPLLRQVPAKLLQSAGRLAAGLELEEVVLRRLQVERVSDLDENNESPMRYSIKDKAAVRSADGGTAFSVDVSLDFSATQKSGEQENSMVKILVEYLLKYSRHEKVTDDVVTECGEAFATTNATYHAWPYYRELISNTLSRMGYPPLFLGTMIVRPAPEKDTEQENLESAKN